MSFNFNWGGNKSSNNNSNSNANANGNNKNTNSNSWGSTFSSNNSNKNNASNNGNSNAFSFGNNSNNNKPNNTGFGFSSNSSGFNKNSNTNTKTNQNTNSLWNSNANNSQNQNKSSFGSSNFGSNTSNSNNNINNNNFGNNNNSNAGGFNFGSNNNNNNNNQNNFNTLNNNGNQNAQNPMPLVQNIVQKYNAQSNECRFQCVLYNKVPKHLINSFEKPQLIRSQIWENGVRNNPDRYNLVPVAMYGNEQLHQRSKLCLAGHVSATKSFEVIGNRIEQLQSNIEQKLKQQILELKQQQINLSSRLLIILREFTLRTTSPSNVNATNPNMTMNRTGYEGNLTVMRLNDTNMNMSQFGSHVQVHSNPHSYPQSSLSRNELKLKKCLDLLIAECQALNSGFDRINNRMNNAGLLSSSNGNQGQAFGMNRSRKINHLNSNPLERSTLIRGNNNHTMLNDYEQLNVAPMAQSMKNIQSFLVKQQSFLKHLITTVKKDCNSLDVIVKGINQYNYKPTKSTAIAKSLGISNLGNNANVNHNMSRNVSRINSTIPNKTNQSVFYVGKYLNNDLNNLSTIGS